MRLVCLSIIGLLYTSNVLGQHNYKFDRLSTDDGLLNNISLALFEDLEGYIWIGGNAGLQRYDGHHFLNFSYDINKPESGLQEMMVRHITQTKDSIIWIGTSGGGVTRIKHGVIHDHLLPDRNNNQSISGLYTEYILEDRVTGHVWIATDNGLDCFQNGQFIKFKHDPNDSLSLSENVVYALMQDSQNRLWVGTRNGLNLHLGTGRFKRYMHDPNDKRSLNAPFVHDLLEDRQGNIWIGLVQGGLDLLNPNTGQIEHHTYHVNDNNSLSNNIVLDLTLDNDSSLMIATFGGGLNRFKDGNFKAFVTDPLDPISIANDYLEEIIIDRNNNIWTANFLGGVNRLSIKPVTSYHFSSNQPNGLPSIATLNKLTVTQSGDVWLGMSGAQLAKFRNGNLSTVRLKPQEKMGSNPLRILDILEAKDGSTWFASNGYGVYQQSNGTIHHYDSTKGLHDNRIFTLAEDLEGRIWIGSDLHGLSVFDNEQFELIESNPNLPNALASSNINDLYCGKDGTIWIATDNGLSSHYDGKIINYSRGFEQDPNFPKYNFLKLVVDNNNVVWAGFDGGVCSFNPSTLEVGIFGMQDGLIDNVVEDLTIDANGDVWVATHQGISRYNDGKGRFESLTSEYGFVDKAILAITSDNNNRRLYFGGSQGLYVLDIDKLDNRKPISSPRLTDLELLGEVPDSVMQAARVKVHKGEHLILPYDYNSFNLYLSSLEYNESNNIQYQIKLEGLEDRFQYLENTSLATYSRVPPGEYKIIGGAKHIRDAEYVNAEMGTLTILKPWWQTRVFYIFVIFGVVLLMAVIINIRTRTLEQTKKSLAISVLEKTKEIESQKEQLSAKNAELEQTINVLSDTQNQLVQAEKMSSLGVLSAGIGHEINNPLNFIKNGALLLKKEMTKPELNHAEMDKYLKFINEGVSRASRIVKSLSHFSRLGERLDESCDVHDILENCLNVLLNNYKNKINLKKAYCKEDLTIEGSEGKLHQVFLNILTNAEQAIAKKGHISIQTLKENEFATVIIEDSGVGISEDNLKKIADPFFTTKPPGQGTGLGMSIAYSIVDEHKGTIQIESKTGKGTKITVKLPFDRPVTNGTA